MSVDQSAKLTYERAKQDLEDIQDLKKHAPFQRYWMRRLKQKMDEADDRLKHGSDSALREVDRQRWLFMEELLSMPAKDEAATRSTLDATPELAGPPKV